MTDHIILLRKQWGMQASHFWFEKALKGLTSNKIVKKQAVLKQQ